MKSLKIPKGVIRSCKSKNDRQYNGQKGKQWSTMFRIESVLTELGNERTNPY